MDKPNPESTKTSTIRATFETQKYHRRPRDQYKAPNINRLELSAPLPNLGKPIHRLLPPAPPRLQPPHLTPPHPKEKLKKFKTFVATTNGRIVKQSRCETV